MTNPYLLMLLSQEPKFTNDDSESSDTETVSSKCDTITPLITTTATPAVTPITTPAITWRKKLENAREYVINNSDIETAFTMGPCCGFYALSVILNFYDINNKPFQGVSSLYKIAKDVGFTTKGELYSAYFMAELASFVNCGYRIYHTWDASTIVSIIDKEHPVLVSFDVDKKGGICFQKGQSAHWGIIEDIRGDKVIVSHGWSDVKYEWDIDDLIRSNQQLEKTIYYETPNKIYDCSHLRNKIIEILPPQ